MSCPPLQPSPMAGVAGPVVCVVMDGIGIGRGDETDAVARAHTPNLDRYATGALATQLCAHGTAVGMPSDGDMGNSEVGHNALGAGRVFAQGAKLVAEALQTRRAFDSRVWRDVMKRCASARQPLHFIGLLSDGNVHSHIDHLIAMLQQAHTEGVAEVYVHALLDGRDVSKTSAHLYIDHLEAVLADINAQPQRRYRIASGGGRMHITMDRYGADWDMVRRGWDTHVRGAGRFFASARQALLTLRNENPGILDQDLPAFVVAEDAHPVGPIRAGNAVIAFNFRGDRMLELVDAFERDPFDHFDRGPKPDVLFAGMTLYDGDTGRPQRYLVAPPQITCTLGELLAAAGVGQLACSETQKFGHVTYFWNGNRSGAFDAQRERYVEIPSLTAPFDQHPEMQAEAITEAVLRELDSGRFRCARINYANGDMVAHTGNLDATVAAVASVDRCLARLEQAVRQKNGALVVTADHGNADDMAERDPRGAPLRDAAGRIVPKTSHSLNPVPFYVLLGERDRGRFVLGDVPQPSLGHVAATLATLLGFAQPEGFLPSLLQPCLPA